MEKNRKNTKNNICITIMDIQDTFFFFAFLQATDFTIRARAANKH